MRGNSAEIIVTQKQDDKSQSHILKGLIGQVHADSFEYAGRANDVQNLERWLAKGDHSTAEFVAKQIIERQQQFRDAQQNGLPAPLQQLVDQVQADAFEYAGRAHDVQNLERWLAKGDHSTAEFVAKQIIERQQNLRQGL